MTVPYVVCLVVKILVIEQLLQYKSRSAVKAAAMLSCNYCILLVIWISVCFV